jgi:hypothetical protein
MWLIQNRINHKKFNYVGSIKLFESKRIRTVWNEEDQRWYFAVADVVRVLTDTPNPTDYIKEMRKRDEELSRGWRQFVTPLYIETTGGKQQVNCADSKGLLRIIHSIPSPKAEPFKLWLAQVGSDRLDEIENPELATQRTRELYKLRGYPEDWIEKRMGSIAIREELTGEWSNRGIKEQKEYSILTGEISKSDLRIDTIGIQKTEKLKEREFTGSLTDLELIFSMLGEASTTAIVKPETQRDSWKIKW